MYKRYKDLAAAKTFLEVDAEGRPSDQRLKVCVVTLLWEMAKANGKVEVQEFEAIVRQMSHEFHLMDDETSELLDVATVIEKERSRLDEFLGEVNVSFNLEQREHLFDMILEVAKADDTFDEIEKDLALVLREKLNLRLS